MSCTEPYPPPPIDPAPDTIPPEIRARVHAQLEQLQELARIADQAAADYAAETGTVPCRRCRGMGDVDMGRHQHPAGCWACDGNGRLPAYRWEAEERGLEFTPDDAPGDDKVVRR